MHYVVFENVKRKKKQGEEKKEHTVILLKHLFGFVYNLIKYDFFFKLFIIILSLFHKFLDSWLLFTQHHINAKEYAVVENYELVAKDTIYHQLSYVTSTFAYTKFDK